MKILAIADPYIPVELLEPGTAQLRTAGHDVEVVTWDEVPSIEKLQEINLLIEQHGANAYPLPPSLTAKIAQAEVVITQFAPIGRAVIEEASYLRLIGVLRAGTENVDSEAATKHGIHVVNTPGRNARAVAEFAVGMILAESRNIARTHAAMQKGIWLKDFPNSDAIPELEGKTIGIIGAGNIGQLVMKFLQGFDVTCLFYDPFTESSQYGEKVEELDDLLRRSDVVSLHARLSAQTYHLLDRRRLDLLKPGAILVNTARSGLVEEEALVEALSTGKLLGAAIDTFDVEPLGKESPWLALENVTLTSHLAGTTFDAFRKTPIMLSQRILDSLKED